VPAEQAGELCGAGVPGGEVGDAEHGDRGEVGVPAGSGDAAFDQPYLLDVRKPEIGWGGADLDGAGGDPPVAAVGLPAELTLSPNHTAGWARVKPNIGLAMRFPRFTGRWREDKSATDATTTDELVDLYRTARGLPAGR
jgi:hypothetical protein